MPHTAKGLYATRLVDLTFALMGAGSAILIAAGQGLTSPYATASAATTATGIAMLASVVLVALASCAAHAIDRRGWDDYMGQVISQSAMIGMVTVLLTGPIIDFLIAPALGFRAPDLMVQGMVPIAALGWAIGYAFLRWKGTNQ